MPLVNIEGVGFVAVRLERDGRSWFAEGVHYDYAAQGDSIQQTLEHFKIGFELTLKLRQERGHDLKSMLWKHRDKRLIVKVPDRIYGLVAQR